MKRTLTQIAADLTAARLDALAYEAGIVGDTKTRKAASRAANGSKRARLQIARLYRDGWLTATAEGVSR